MNKEVPHADPEAELLQQCEELRNSIHALLRERVRAHCERGKGRLSVHFTERESIYSQVADNIVYDLEISSEMDAETLREWVKEIKENPSILNPLIREHLPN